MLASPIKLVYAALVAALAALAAVVALAAAGGTQPATAQTTSLEVPVGAVMPYSGGGAPTGWLVADGSAVSRTQYAGLFSVIGTAYGAGDGSTTFNLPDLRGRGVVGKGTHAEVDSVGDNDGLSVGSRKVKHRHGKGTLAIGSSGSHYHEVSNVTPYISGAAGSERGNPTQRDAGGTPWATNTGGAHSHPSSSFSGEVGDTGGPLDGPAYQVLTYLIKY
jgi:microcystin-dependent protein